MLCSHAGRIRIAPITPMQPARMGLVPCTGRALRAAIASPPATASGRILRLQGISPELPDEPIFEEQPKEKSARSDPRNEHARTGARRRHPGAGLRPGFWVSSRQCPSTTSGDVNWKLSMSFARITERTHFRGATERKVSASAPRNKPARTGARRPPRCRPPSGGSGSRPGSAHPRRMEI